MKTTRKALSLFLALVITAGLFPVSAFADDGTITSASEGTIAITKESPESSIALSDVQAEPKDPEEGSPPITPAETEEAPSNNATEEGTKTGTRDVYIFTEQPKSGGYDPGSLTYTVTWETNFTPVLSKIMKKNSAGFFDTFSSDNNSNQVDWGFYAFPAKAGTDTYCIYAYYGEGSSDYVSSNEFTVTANGVFTFTEQPISDGYDPGTLTYTVIWKTNFVPVLSKIMKKNAAGFFDTFSSDNNSSQVDWGFYSFPAQYGTETYCIYAYYGEGSSDYIASSEFTVTADGAFTFTEQPKSGSYDPGSLTYTVIWKTNFTPVLSKIMKKNSAGFFDTFSSDNNSGQVDWGFYSFPAKAGTDTYCIYAYYGEGNSDYVSSSEFTVTADGAFIFTEQPESGSYDPSSLSYAASWKTNFVPVLSKIMKKNTAGFFNTFSSDNNSNQVDWGFYIFPAKAGTDTYCIYAYYGEGDSDYVSSSEFTVTADGAFIFTEQPESGGFDVQTQEYIITWKMNFAPVETEIQKMNTAGYFNEIASFSNSSNLNWGFYTITASSGTGIYRVAAYYGNGSSDFVTSNEVSVYAIPISGECGVNGDNLTWHFAPDSGQLTISGTGQMEGYWRDFFPWTTWRDQIQTVVIEEGVEDVSAYAFENSPALTSVLLPSTLTSIEDYAFNGCPALADATINMSQQQFSAVTWDKTKNTGLRDASKHFTFIAGGQAGPALTWKLSNDGMLRFSGSGAMYDWSSSEPAPWYPYRSSITGVDLTNAATVGNYAFRGCTGLSSVSIARGVNSLGLSAFAGCTGLSTVTWDSVSYATVTEIPAACFSGCTALQSFTVSKNCTVIGQGAFSGCDALTAVKFLSDNNNVLTTVGKRAFYSCDNLASITLPESVTSLGDEAFYNCKSLTSFPLPPGLTSLGEYCFCGCSGVTGIVTIPAGITEIPERCFLGCSGFYKLELTPSVTQIGAYAFSGCSALTNVDYDGFEAQWKATTVAGGNDLLKNASFSWLFRNGTLSTGVKWTLYGGPGRLVIWGSGAMPNWPGSPESAPWYQYRDYIEVIDVNAGVTQIGAYAFSGYPAVTTVHLPTSVTLVAGGAFLNCSSLHDVWYYGSELMRQAKLTINTPNSSLENAQWHYSDIIGPVTGPQGGVDLTWSFDPDSGILRIYWDEDQMDQNEMAIPDYEDGRDTPWYEYNNGQLIPLITTVQVDELVTEIGSCAFAGLSELTDVQIASTVTRIGEGAFMGCNNLIDITIPDTVDTLDDDIFWNCGSLETVRLPAGLTEIPYGTFYDCEELTTVYIPGSVTGIEKYAFYRCVNLADICFGGTSAQWCAVELNMGNDPVNSATIHFTPPEIAVDAANFPDENFRAYVAQDIDTDRTGWLTTEECLGVHTICCANSSIESLEGIEYFPNLRHLDCSGNAIDTALDLSGFPLLQSVNAGSNQLTGLNVTGLVMLSTLIFSDNDTGMNAPDLSTNTALTYLDCRNCDGLEDLDLSANVALTDLDCSWNQLDALDLSANTELQQLNCSHNSISVLDLSANTELCRVICNDNVLTSLTLGRQKYSFNVLSCYGNSISTLDLTGCPHLRDAVLEGERSVTDRYVEHCKGDDYVWVDPDTILHASSEGIPIDTEHFPDNIFRTYVADKLDPNGDLWLIPQELAAVEDIDCSAMGIESIQGVEHFAQLRTLDCSDNNLTVLSFSGNPLLNDLNCRGNEELVSLDVSNLSRLEVLSSEGCLALTAIDVSNNARLRELDSHECALTALTLGGPEDLWYLDCSGNALPALDLSGCTSLRYLMCSGNALTTLDVSGCPAMEVLECYNNQITSLDLSLCQELRAADCHDNALITLFLGHLPGLKELYCQHNSLTNLDVWDCPCLLDLVQTTEQIVYEDYVYYTEGDREFDLDPDVTLVTDHDGIPIDAAHFPDQAFRTWVHDIPDTDGNWYLNDAERAAVDVMVISSEGIASLQGIHYFTELQELECDGNQIAELDLSANTRLDYLICDSNPLTELDLGANAALSYLSCENCRLTTLDLSANTQLSSVTCGYNAMTELLLPAGTKLSTLYCNNNALTSLDFSLCAGIQVLHCESNALTELILGEQPNLNHLHCEHNDLPRLDIIWCPLLLELVENGTKTTANGVVTYNGNVALCMDESTVPVTDHDGIPVDEENFPDEAFRTYIAEKIDLNGNGWLNETEINAVTYINISSKGVENLEGVRYFSSLEELVCYDNGLTGLDLEDLTLLHILDAHGNPFTTLDLSSCPSLTMVELQDTPSLTGIDVSGLTQLDYLDVSRCGLTALDVSACRRLTYLECERNPLRSLTLGKQPELAELYCYGTGDGTGAILTEVDIRECPYLVDAYLNGEMSTPDWGDRYEGMQGGVLYVDAGTKVIAAYEYEEPAYTWTATEDGYTVTALKACPEDPALNITETVSASYAVTTAPGCEAAGVGTYTATFADPAFETQTKTEAIPATGHTEVTDAAVASTCTETGLTEGKHCSVCGKVLAAQEVIPALGHAWSEWTVTKEPTCTEAGVETRVCANDPSHKETRDVAALGHNWGEPVYAWAEDSSSVTATVACANETTHVATETVATSYAVIKEPTAAETGTGVYTAEFESELFTKQTKEVEIPALEVSYAISETSLAIPFGETRTLTVKDDKGNVVTAAWSSNNNEIASVNNGVVTANKVGTATITAMAGGSKLTCEVLVQFTDVTDPTQFYYEPIYNMVDQGVIGGYDDGTFRPNGNCNRAAVVTFLWRLAKCPEPKAMATFSDMPTNNEDFCKAISWAAEQGITTGYAGNLFKPWATCNRAAIVTFLWRYAGKPEAAVMATFKDMPTDNEDFCKAISWAAEKGITTGWDDNTFRPWNTCNRLAVASFLDRYTG